MNILTLIFSLLLILSYTFFACTEKQIASSRLITTYLGHEKASRELLNQYESALYKGRHVKRVGTEKKEPSPKKEAVENEEDEGAGGLNRECAQLNLWPLIQEGRDNHPLLFELALKVIQTFYAPLLNEKQLDLHFLTTLLKEAKLAAQEQGEGFSLEKVDLRDPKLQRLYYKMLKGTKEWDLASQIGYPSLLDYMKVDPMPTKICIFHAHCDLTRALFGPQMAEKLHKEIHTAKRTLLTPELMERLSLEAGNISIDPTLFTLLELGKPYHPEENKTFIVKDGATGVSLKKTITLEKKG